jgi:hypothetical protein
VAVGTGDAAAYRLAGLSGVLLLTGAAAVAVGSRAMFLCLCSQRIAPANAVLTAPPRTPDAAGVNWVEPC